MENAHSKLKASDVEAAIFYQKESALQAQLSSILSDYFLRLKRGGKNNNNNNSSNKDVISDAMQREESPLSPHRRNHASKDGKGKDDESSEGSSVFLDSLSFVELIDLVGAELVHLPAVPTAANYNMAIMQNTKINAVAMQDDVRMSDIDEINTEEKVGNQNLSLIGSIEEVEEVDSLEDFVPNESKRAIVASDSRFYSSSFIAESSSSSLSSKSNHKQSINTPGVGSSSILSAREAWRTALAAARGGERHSTLAGSGVCSSSSSSASEGGLATTVTQLFPPSFSSSYFPADGEVYSSSSFSSSSAAAAAAAAATASSSALSSTFYPAATARSGSSSFAERINFQAQARAFSSDSEGGVIGHSRGFGSSSFLSTSMPAPTPSSSLSHHALPVPYASSAAWVGSAQQGISTPISLPVTRNQRPAASSFASKTYNSQGGKGGDNNSNSSSGGGDYFQRRAGDNNMRFSTSVSTSYPPPSSSGYGTGSDGNSNDSNNNNHAFTQSAMLQAKLRETHRSLSSLRESI